MERKTHEQFVADLELKNKTIHVLDRYVNVSTKIMCECEVCGHIWSVKPNSLLTGHGCPMCARKSAHNKLAWTSGRFIDELSKANPDVELLSDYYNFATKVRCRCKIDGHEWEQYPQMLLNGRRCPMCAGELYRKGKPHEQFVTELKKINPYIEIISQYKRSRLPVKCKCAHCGNTWTARPDGLLRGTGCPFCQESHGEREVRKYLDANGIRYQYQKSYDGLYGLNGGKLSFDFFLLDYNLLIEYQGAFHDGTTLGGYKTGEALERQEEHDRRKREFAEENNIGLLEIWYWDFDNISQILDKAIRREGDYARNK